jgi:hypothetical protein
MSEKCFRSWCRGFYMSEKCFRSHSRGFYMSETSLRSWCSEDSICNWCVLHLSDIKADLSESFKLYPT